MGTLESGEADQQLRSIEPSSEITFLTDFICDTLVGISAGCIQFTEEFDGAKGLVHTIEFHCHLKDIDGTMRVHQGGQLVKFSVDIVKEKK